MQLTKYEKETIILFNESEDEASIYTYNAGLKTRLANFSRKYPQLCRMKEGLGITIDFIAQMHQIPQVKAIPFKDPAFTWEVYMAVKKRESLPKGAEAFWKYLTALF